MDGDKGCKDMLIFHDTAGLDATAGPAELKKPYVQVRSSRTHALGKSPEPYGTTVDLP